MIAAPIAEAAVVRPPLKGAGGKRWLEPHLRPLWEPFSDRLLVEPFCGGLAIALGLMPRRATRDNRHGFTVIEIIGVLAVLVIVLCLVLPGTLRRANQVPQLNNNVDEARIEQTVVALQSLKIAAQERLGQFGSLAATDGVTPGNGDYYDKQLVREGFLEKPFAAEVGTRCIVRLLNASALTAASPVSGVPGAYDLDGDGRNDVIHARWVLEAVIFGVTDVEAKALNDRLDGPTLSQVVGNDSKGRVIWTSQSKEVHVYIAQGN